MHLTYMAHYQWLTQDPNTNGSQFFIVQMKEVPQNMLSQLADGGWPQPIVDAYGEKGGTPWLDQNIQYSVKSLMVKLLLEDIANTKVGPQDKPLHDVVIESIDVEE